MVKFYIICFQWFKNPVRFPNTKDQVTKEDLKKKKKL